MRVVVLGATGMLGHKTLSVLRVRHEVKGFIRRDPRSIPLELRVLCESLAADPYQLAQAVAALKPDYIINCAGAVKQRDAGRDLGGAYAANVVLPLELDRAAEGCGARLIHISTDCVFAGEVPGARPFTLDHSPDAHDVYGVSKRAGELVAPGAMTLRTSIVGPELFDKTGLLEWAMSSRGKRVTGFERAVFSGVPTVTLARIIDEIIGQGLWQRGLFQVATVPVNKADWLAMVDSVFDLDLTIDRSSNFYCDRTLDGSAFERLLGRKLAEWPELVLEMHADYVSNLDMYQGR